MADRLTRAFPTLYDARNAGDWETKDGMSLRDWYAGLALAGLVNGNGTVQAIAKVAYQLADAMMVERDREPLL